MENEEVKNIEDIINNIVSYNNNIYDNLHCRIENGDLDYIFSNENILNDDGSCDMKTLFTVALAIYHDNINNSLAYMSLKHAKPCCNVLQ